MCPVNFHVFLVNVFWPLVVTLGVVGVYSLYIVWISTNLNNYKSFILILFNGICDMDWAKKLVMVAIWCVQVVLEGLIEAFYERSHSNARRHSWDSTPPCPFLYSLTSEAEKSSMGFSNNIMKKWTSQCWEAHYFH